MLELKGTVIHVGEVTTGEGKRKWKRQTVVLSVKDGEYQNTVAVQLWDDKCDFCQEGQTAKVSAKVTSNEYNGKWYTNVSAFLVSVVQPEIEPEDATDDATSGMEEMYPPKQVNVINDTGADDLPF